MNTETKPVPAATEKTAASLLRAARAANPEASIGFARRDRVIVTWDRPGQSYDVGTEARSHAKGRRSEVLPALVALLDGAS